MVISLVNTVCLQCVLIKRQYQEIPPRSHLITLAGIILQDSTELKRSSDLAGHCILPSCGSDYRDEEKSHPTGQTEEYEESD